MFMSLDIKLPIISVKALREMKFKVHVKHSRCYYRYEGMGKVEIDLLSNSVGDVRFAIPRGGSTQVALIDQNGCEFIGIARCSSHDQYNKKIGVQLALTDAIRKLLISRTVK